MKIKNHAAPIVAAFLILLPLSARAETREGAFELEPFIGYNFFESRQNLNNAFEFGGRLGYNFTKNVAVEGALAFVNTNVIDSSLTNVVPGQFRGSAGNVSLTSYHIDAVYTLMPDGKFNPFVLAGFGGASYSPSIETNNMAAFNLGVGAKYWVADNIAIRFDLGDYMVTEVFSRSYHNIGATIGITFAFGGNEKPAPAQAATVEAKPEPKAEKKVVVLASEPKAEEKVKAIAALPVEEEKVVVLAFEDVHFDYDKSVLTDDAKMILKRNVEILRQNPNVKIRVAGYTSAKGTAEYNQKLSERRAKAVRDYLVEEGIVPPDRLSEIGYGATKPAMYEAAPNEIYSEAARANMRVLFEVEIK